MYVKLNLASHNRKRRLILKLIGLLPISWATLGSTSIRVSDNSEEEILFYLKLITDELIPRDSTPSASDLNVHEELLMAANEVTNYPELIKSGITWLRNSSYMSFNRDLSEINTSQRQKLLKAAFQQPDRTLPKVFCDRLLEDCMQLYYEQPESWQGLPINQPIQPMGYPDHSDE